MSKQQLIRLKKRKQFVLISEKGTKHVSLGLVLQALPNRTEDIRIGFTVTKRIGCAVIRNRVRRRLREVVRLLPDVYEMKGYDLVVVGRKSTLDRPFDKLLKDLSYTLHDVRNDMSSKTKNKDEQSEVVDALNLSDVSAVESI